MHDETSMMRQVWWYRYDDTYMIIQAWWYKYDETGMMVQAWWYIHDNTCMMIHVWWYRHDDMQHPFLITLNRFIHDFIDWYILIYFHVSLKSASWSKVGILYVYIYSE